MFEILPNPSFETLLIAGRGMLLVGEFWVLALAFSRWRRQDERSTLQLRAQLDRSFAELRSLHETIAVIIARIDSIASPDSEPRAARSPAGGSAALGYDIATRIARNGASLEDLVSNCGITRHEAELLLSVQGA